MSSHTYTDTDLDTFDAEVLGCRARAASYTNLSTHWDNGSPTELIVTVTETVTKETLEAALNTTTPTLSVSPSDVGVDNTYTCVLTADGVDTTAVTLIDSRGAAATGNVVELSFKGLIKVDTTSVTLDSSGEGVVTFGPFSSGWRTAPNKSISIKLEAQNSDCAPAWILLKVT